MHAMVLKKLKSPLEWLELPDRHPGANEIRVKVLACGVCRTDLHVVDGELKNPQLPIIPGHEIVGRIDVVGAQVTGLAVSEHDADGIFRYRYTPKTGTSGGFGKHALEQDAPVWVGAPYRARLAQSSPGHTRHRN